MVLSLYLHWECMKNSGIIMPIFLDVLIIREGVLVAGLFVLVLCSVFVGVCERRAPVFAEVIPD